MNDLPPTVQIVRPSAKEKVAPAPAEVDEMAAALGRGKGEQLAPKAEKRAPQFKETNMTTKSHRFSSNRTVAEYASEIRDAKSCPIEL